MIRIGAVVGIERSALLQRQRMGSSKMRNIKQAAAWIVPVLALASYAGHARADEHMVLVDTIDVGGNGLGAFDISFVDPRTGLYVLSDRTNASIDFFNARDDTFIGRVGGFKGVADEWRREQQFVRAGRCDHRRQQGSLGW